MCGRIGYIPGVGVSSVNVTMPQAFSLKLGPLRLPPKGFQVLEVQLQSGAE